MKRELSRSIAYECITGIIISMLLVGGYSTKYRHGFSLTLIDVVAFAVLAMLITTATVALFHFFDKHKIEYDRNTRPWVNRLFAKSWVYFLVCSLLLFVLWIPAFLAFYPGLFVYDAQWQYFMYLNREVTTHHPIIHTYLLGFCIDSVHKLTGSINKGIAAYTLVQMMLMSLGCGTILYLLHRRKSKMWMHILSFVIFVINPVFVIFVFSSTKDSFFSVVIAVFVFLCYEILEDKEMFFARKCNPVLWVLFGFLAATLRNNAIYPLVIVSPFFTLYLLRRKGNKTKCVAMVLSLVILIVVFRGPVTKAVTVGGTSKAEMLSVPCQQIMRIYAYHGDDLTDDRKDTINRLFDSKAWYGYYVPEIADATKGSLRMDEYEKDLSFWNLWMELLIEYPQEYVDAFLENTYAFWYPWPRYVIYSFGGEGYTPITCMQPGEVNSKLPILLNYYKNFENGAIVQGLKIVSWLFAPATYMYLAFIVAMYLIRDKKFDGLIPMLFVSLLWCTFLLGPVAMARYALYLFVLVAIWPVLIFGQIRLR